MRHAAESGMSWPGLGSESQRGAGCDERRRGGGVPDDSRTQPRDESLVMAEENQTPGLPEAKTPVAS
ncbi:hypothetical protein EYF80_018471 [Liparis tanakae]|uniref:Uncharacterized protein n=1 Tax=Liparis tanakae TaxID=230148 RepID=A0A4Z2HZI9_9TELE|nr:hypothetical protein EYF80_018471 [Liparis tanakae]